MTAILAFILKRKWLIGAIGGAVLILLLTGLFIHSLHKADSTGYDRCQTEHTSAQQAADLQKSLEYNKAQDTIATIQAGIETKRQKTNVIIQKSNDSNIPAAVLSDTVDSLYP